MVNKNFVNYLNYCQQNHFPILFLNENKVRLERGANSHVIFIITCLGSDKTEMKYIFHIEKIPYVFKSFLTFAQTCKEFKLRLFRG